MSPCRTAAASGLATDTVLTRLRGQGPAARGTALAGDIQRPTPLVPWLLGVALLCALAELAVRAHTRRELA
jgi:hypothetical protein